MHGAEKQTEDEFLNIHLPPNTPWREMIESIQGAHGCENDISFPCLFFRRADCRAHALLVETRWSFACDYPCRDFIPTLAENNPAFADLVRRYGCSENAPTPGAYQPDNLTEAEDLIGTCEHLQIPLSVDDDGTLVVRSDVPASLASALETHADAIAWLIDSLNHYSDPERTCDTMWPGIYGEPQADCCTGEHAEVDIIARWRASLYTKPTSPPATPAERAGIDRLAAAAGNDEGPVPGINDGDEPLKYDREEVRKELELLEKQGRL